MIAEVQVDGEYADSIAIDSGRKPEAPEFDISGARSNDFTLLLSCRVISVSSMEYGQGGYQIEEKLHACPLFSDSSALRVEFPWAWPDFGIAICERRLLLSSEASDAESSANISAAAANMCLRAR